MSEKKFTRFLMTTSIGGIFFLIPVIILGAIIAKAMGMMMAVAEPMASWLPVETIGGVALANIIALVALLLVCFIAGLIARLALASSIVNHLESKILVNVPGYLMLKGLVSGIDPSKTEGLQPVALLLGSSERVGLEIEKLKDGRSVVFIPGAPNPYSGITQVLPPAQVCRLDVPVKAIIEVSENFGHGMEGLLSSRKGDS